MGNDDTVGDLKKRTKEWNKEVKGLEMKDNDDYYIEITLIRNKYPLWIKNKDTPDGPWEIIEDLDNTTTLGEFTKKMMDKIEKTRSDLGQNRTF